MSQHRQGSGEIPCQPLEPQCNCCPGTNCKTLLTEAVLQNWSGINFLKAQGYSVDYCYSSLILSIYYFCRTSVLLLLLPGLHKYFLHEAPIHISNHSLTMACPSIWLMIKDMHVSAGTACHSLVRTCCLLTLQTSTYLNHTQNYKYLHIQKGKSDVSWKWNKWEKERGGL